VIREFFQPIGPLECCVMRPSSVWCACVCVCVKIERNGNGSIFLLQLTLFYFSVIGIQELLSVVFLGGALPLFLFQVIQVENHLMLSSDSN